MNINKIVYYVGTGLLTFIMAFSVFNYFFNTDMIKGFFTNLGYPTYLVYPLAIAKILGLIAIWTNLSKSLKEWAYAGFFFNILLAFVAHALVDGGYLFSIIAMIGLIVSYISWKRID